MKVVIFLNRDKKGFFKGVFIFLLIFIVIGGLFLFGAKIYLLANLLLGHDTIIKLSADKENLFLQNGETQEINFKTNVIINPFCSSYCNYKFRDLSENKLIDSGEFNIKSTIPVSKNYILTSDNLGKGQEIYSFDIGCKSVKTSLCHTNREEVNKRILVTLNYDLNEKEMEIKNFSEDIIISSLKYINNASTNLNLLVSSLNSSSENFREKTLVLESKLSQLNQSANNLKNYWENSDYQSVSSNVESLNSSLSSFEIEYKNLVGEINSYNFFVENLSFIRGRLEKLKEINTTKNISEEINLEIKNFNSLLNSNKKLEEKKLVLDNLRLQIEKTFQKINESANICCFADEKIEALNLQKIIVPVENSIFEISLKEKSAECCIFGNCSTCCDDSCRNDKNLFPVLFLHGHDFNRATSAEYSLNVFSAMQKKFDDEGRYTNAGTIWISDYNENLRGILGFARQPISFIGSYYFDIYKNTGQTVLIQTKTDNLDRYALRLKEIIEEIKFKTGRDKVIIVSHSMGGLVVRKYIDIFGESAEKNIDKIIMIGTPNKGISGKISYSCYLFGSNSECADLKSDSLFISKLNNAKKINVPIYNLIGVGCDMDGENGDGIVTEKSVYFDGAENYYVNGTCDLTSLRFLHTDLINPVLHPEVYQIINEDLKK